MEKQIPRRLHHVLVARERWKFNDYHVFAVKDIDLDTSLWCGFSYDYLTVIGIVSTSGMGASRRGI